MDEQPYGAAEADARIHAVIRAVSDLLTQGPRLPAVDPADLRGLLGDCGGVGVAGHGVASGPGRATKAAEAAMADLEDQLAAARYLPPS